MTALECLPDTLQELPATLQHNIDVLEALPRPKRVQRQRTKGWKAPLCGCRCGKLARYVGRGSKWGNPVLAKKSARVDVLIEIANKETRA